MLPDLERIARFFTRWVNEHGDAGPFGEVAVRLAAEELDPAGFSALCERHGACRERWFRAGIIDLVLAYARTRLEERLLTIEDITDIQVLKHALHVREGELIEHRPAELSAFIQMAVEAILADDRIDEYEERYLAGIQAAFDLSYDQFLALGRAALERAIADIDFRRAIAGRNGDTALADVLTRKRGALEPIVYLTSLQRRTMGALY